MPIFQELKVIRLLSPILKLYPWVIPVIIILGILSSLSEVIGISLLFSFLQSFSSTTSQVAVNSPLLNILHQIFIDIPQELRSILIASLILLAITFKLVLSYLYTLLCNWIKVNTTYYLRKLIFNQIVIQSPNFFDSYNQGELHHKIITETRSYSTALTHFIWAIIDVCMIFVFTIVLLFISWQLTLLVIIALFLISSFTYYLTRQAKKIGKDNLTVNVQLQNLLQEGLSGIKTIQAFGRENHEQKKFIKVANLAQKLEFKATILSAIIDPISEGAAVALIILLMFFALKNQFTVPAILTFIFMLYRLQPQVKKFDNNRLQLKLLTSSVKTILSLLEDINKPSLIDGIIPFSTLKTGLTFKSVTFYYNSQERPAINNISFFIPQGKTTAIVGYSGAGKSTIINLIFRFYDVNKGIIYIDNYPLQKLDLASWRSRIAMVSQDVHIFNTTVRENILYGRLDATEEEMITAAKQAHAHEFIRELPQGYDTQVGDRGVRLSGGQRQRISIARTILSNPEILILDEATNALDTISEAFIQDAINTLSQNSTVIVIAHRLSTIKQADQIIVLDRGKLVEQGSFQHLLDINGTFAKLYQKDT